MQILIKVALIRAIVLYSMDEVLRNKADIGNVRETFFMNQTRVTNDVISSKISDFEIDGRTFEIGGRNKGNKQIENADEGYVVKDDIETGYANVIPIWAFGLLY